MAKIAALSNRSRGCPSCGSHDTVLVLNQGQWCNQCGHRWTPCKPYCRGYQVEVSPLPRVVGCPQCGVPDHIAMWWPEAYRLLSVELLKHYDKMEPTPILQHSKTRAG